MKCAVCNINEGDDLYFVKDKLMCSFECWCTAVNQHWDTVVFKMKTSKAAKEPSGTRWF